MTDLLAYWNLRERPFEATWDTRFYFQSRDHDEALNRLAYLVGWLLIVGCLFLEHWIARRRSLNWINIAFFRLNAVVSSIFLFVTLAEVIFQGGFRLR